MTSFRAFRESRGLSHARLAKLAGCRPHLVSYYERSGRLTHPEHLDPLAAALGITPEELRTVLIVLAPPRPRLYIKLTGNGKCGDCGRRKYVWMGAETTLECPSFCRWCARPLTDAAKAKAPLDGFIAAANGSARRGSAWRTTVVFGGEDRG